MAGHLRIRYLHRGCFRCHDRFPRLEPSDFVEQEGDRGYRICFPPSVSSPTCAFDHRVLTNNPIA